MRNRPVPKTRSVLISGASTGIGQCCALTLARLGFRIFAGFRKPADGERLRSLHPAIFPVPLEVTCEISIQNACDTIHQQLAGKGLDGLVNNAGIVIGGPLELVSIADWRHQLDVNLIGQIAVTQAFLPLLRQSRGRIVNMGSVAGINALPFVSPYSASKFALAAITDALRLELKPWGVHVALIEPGSVATPIWEKARQTAETAHAAWPEPHRNLYGMAMERIKIASQKSASRGVSPEMVARAVHHALTSASPKTRYPVGTDARFRRPFSWLPDSIRDMIISAKIGLPTGQPDI